MHTVLPSDLDVNIQRLRVIKTKMMKRIVKALKSKKTALLLLLACTFLSLLIIYARWESTRILVTRGTTLAMLLLAVSLTVCSWARLRHYIMYGRNKTGPSTLYRDTREIPLGSEIVLARIIGILSRKKYRVNVAGEEVTAIKNLEGLLGSVAFHLGLVLLLTGFAVNVLWGYRGTVLLPERVLLKMPDELNTVKQGWLYQPPSLFYVGLEKFHNKQEKAGEPGAFWWPEGTLYFRAETQESRRQVRVNYPAYTQGLYWRHKNSGYSLFVEITSPQGTLVSDYANIASHGGTSWSDTVDINKNLKLNINFYPDFVETRENLFASRSIFPNKPVMELTIYEEDKKTGHGLIPMGQMEAVGKYAVSFKEFRYWQLLDVSADPGKYFIWVGGLLAVTGLAVRAVLITKDVYLTVTPGDEGKTTVNWSATATYGKVLFRQEIQEIINRLEDKEVDDN